MMTWLNPIRWLLTIGLVASLVLGYRTWAEHLREQGRAEVRASLQQQANQANAQRAAVATPIAEQHDKAVERIVTVTHTITKEVPVYVPSDSCELPGGFRLLHDAAAHGQLPDPAGIPDAAAVPAQDAAATVADNYGTCREISQRLIDLQAWVKAQIDLNEGEKK